jgi:hypothetical protein
MAEDWDFYFCRVNDVPSSIFVDLGLRAQAPDPTRPHLLWVWVPMRHPRPDGLSSAEETTTLGALEDALGHTLRQRADAVLAGRITGAGRREFYFYARSADGVETQVATVLRNFSGYSFEAGAQPDADWAQYRELLYPHPHALEQIKNRRVLAALEAAGDVPAIPRPITHWLYFAEPAARATTAAALAAAGFSVTLEEERAEAAPHPYPLRAKRVDRAEEDAVDAAVFQILEAIAGAEAEYDRWEAPVKHATRAAGP